MKPTIRLNKDGSFRKDGKPITLDEARAIWDRTGSADWSLGACHAMARLVLGKAK